MNIEKGKQTNSGFSERDLEYIKNFRLMDDDFMAKFFEENLECTEFVLRIIMDNPDLQVQSVHTQHEIRNLLGHSVRLDAYATDKNAKKYNIEIQRSDKGASPKRARYHSSVLDSNILPKGEDYDFLMETYVIFITEHDEMREGLPIYHIDRTVRETGALFRDEAHIIYVNGEYRENDSPIGVLMHDFACKNPADMQYKVLAERARYLKESREGQLVMCKAMEEMRNESILAERKQTAIRLIRAGKLSNEEIAVGVNLALEEVQKLAEEVSEVVMV
ncbi:MAG: PD-(D/E)XK nuclease family transposase [Muribaculaceae bacterium]|nr:PD-(D/E)XK nuclease family transposase [Roseburia sp.]MCM1430696.1 PD-(D/E)XK nuclease family transposase [Muribaculaceae bacterium]MCM1491963.1 PD-(D/E)XK nuclease family transposase [Muribaculaceae bacterium]